MVTQLLVIGKTFSTFITIMNVTSVFSFVYLSTGIKFSLSLKHLANSVGRTVRLFCSTQKKGHLKLYKKIQKGISNENISKEQSWIFKFGLILPSLFSMEFTPPLNFFPQEEKKDCAINDKMRVKKELFS